MGGVILLLVLAFFVGEVLAGLSPICGIDAVRAQWSLWLVFVVVVVVFACLWAFP